MLQLKTKEVIIPHQSLSIIDIGKKLEWLCPKCNKFYYQSKTFGSKEEFKFWIIGHLKRCRGY